MALAGALVSVKVVVPLDSVASQSPLRRMKEPSEFQLRVTVFPFRTAVHVPDAVSYTHLTLPTNREV